MGTVRPLIQRPAYGPPMSDKMASTRKTKNRILAAVYEKSATNPKPMNAAIRAMIKKRLPCEALDTPHLRRPSRKA